MCWSSGTASSPPRRASCLSRSLNLVCKILIYNWLQVFKRAHTALLGSGGGPEQRTSLVPSEKCAVSWGSDDDERRMITASFVRAIERFAGDLCRHFLPLFQQVVAIRKTCNQLKAKTKYPFRLRALSTQPKEGTWHEDQSNGYIGRLNRPSLKCQSP
jgi:hypothetical protein